MNTTAIKASASIKIDADILAQVRQAAKAEHKSLSNYLENILYRFGYRPYNEETAQACQEAKERKSEGIVDTSSLEAFTASILGDEKD